MPCRPSRDAREDLGYDAAGYRSRHEQPLGDFRVWGMKVVREISGFGGGGSLGFSQGLRIRRTSLDRRLPLQEVRQQYRGRNQYQ